MIYYTADLHFGHANVIRYDNRPFASVQEMDHALIKNWQARVREDDDVYIAGDLCFRNTKGAAWYLGQLPGKKHLIIGNHDGVTLGNRQAAGMLAGLEDILQTRDNGHRLVICHFPLAEWPGIYSGVWHIYGHIHNNTHDTFHLMKHREKALNAGCMINNYMPVTFDELVENNRRFREEHWNDPAGFERNPAVEV